MEVLKVSSGSAPNMVAGAIANVMRRDGKVELQTIGAGATNQAVKAIAIARGYLIPVGINLTCTPLFGKTETDGTERTHIRFICFDCGLE
ncbi:MAG: stage V sporulation protein S [Oscillospiraceae bacterium]|jgi:stage V sporulation protein S|nr:stage V sporulation protein S [Oscillospiraceae bacterium]MBQ9208209.1 stage V sporulation protein S [Oscillospiraceae bacterium]MBR4345799.1 stage V sporulation protein S [Oscillospiraceae bacterium]